MNTAVLVSRKQLEASLAAVSARVLDPNAGIHGPGTVSWQLNRQAINLLGGGRAALLQLAHPYVAYGVDQHSTTRSDARGRFQRTFDAVFAMTFGDLASAFQAARRVHEVHSRVHGTLSEAAGRFERGHRYHANESSALLWVFATLIDTVLAIAGRRESRARREEFYQASKNFARLFGIPDSELPADCASFDRYVRATMDSDLLAVTEPALAMSRFLLAPPRAALSPMWRWYRTVTAGLLPERLRKQYELRYDWRERAIFRSSMRLLPAAFRGLPPVLRYHPAYTNAERRVRGKSPSPAASWVARMTTALATGAQS